MTLDNQLAALPVMGSISVTIRDGRYVFYANRMVSLTPIKVQTIEVHAQSFDEGANALIAAFR